MTLALKKWTSRVETITGSGRDACRACQGQEQPGDLVSEVKLRKIYERTQRSCAIHRSNGGNRRRKRSARNSRAPERIDVEHGYADGNQIAWLFLALARAAGIPADPVIVSTRDVHFFNANVMNPNDLNSNVVVATLDGMGVVL